MPMPPKQPYWPADQHDHRNAGGAHVEHRAHHLGHGDQAGVGLVQAHAAGLDQQQHGGRAARRSARSQQADQLGAVHLADAAAHEAAFLGGDEDRAAIERAAADDDAVVERAGHAELARCGLTTRSAGGSDLVKAAGVEQTERGARGPVHS